MTATLTLVDAATALDTYPDAPTQPSAPPRRHRRWRVHVVMTAIAVFSCFPVYWMLVTALREPGHEYDQTPIPWPPSLDSLRYVFDTLPVWRMLGNTMVFAVAVTAAQLFTSLLAAYAFARWEFFGKNLLFAAFLATWLVPFQVTMIPNYVLLSERHWLDSLAGIVVPQLAGAYGVLMLRQHMKGFPTEILDAARLDGKGPLTTLWRVIVPNIQGPLTALGLLLFVTAWNDYLWPMLVFRNADSVIQVGVQSLIASEGSNNWGAVMAASALACIPLLVLFVVLQRRLIDAFVRSGLK
ncbi:carbohydrate ABC transporter permease [Desertimonas flava]|uniref:carbohydrate ABC transporter permease n=1 Tax=Desertimonas flava TaxID=2064846 RepID=UPI000E3462EA|nr:carbohydrate ABC transporter permease [Desertimonas flava]